MEARRRRSRRARHDREAAEMVYDTGSLTCVDISSKPERVVEDCRIRSVPILWSTRRSLQRHCGASWIFVIQKPA